MPTTLPVDSARSVPRPFRPYVVAEKPAISVIGLGYVGAVTCGCLARLGHRIVGVDVDPDKVATIGAGRTPIHEAGLEDLLSRGVAGGTLTTTGDIDAAIRETVVTFVSVGTPTAEDGGCDPRHIEAAADAIGDALRDKAEFHVVVLRCSVPPGTTHGLMSRRIEARAGKTVGHGFGIAFVPEFLREGVAVQDFHEPPKTVIGASDDKTAAIVARIFEPIDPAPRLTGIETAELVKYVDNVWHAAKVCFGNEVGRLAKSMGVDGREVMDIFCEDTKLNISPAYLRPGFAYGGSCLPKEVRAVSHLAGRYGVDLPMIESLAPSNAAQIAAALRLIRATGARRVGVLGLAFKPGTDDLRESPILDVMAELMAEGVELLAHDHAVTSATPIARQLAYVTHGAPGLSRLAARLPDLLAETASEVIAGSDVVVVTHVSSRYRALLDGASVRVIDLAGLLDREGLSVDYDGIGW